MRRKQGRTGPRSLISLISTLIVEMCKESNNHHYTSHSLRKNFHYVFRLRLIWYSHLCNETRNQGRGRLIKCLQCDLGKMD
ncbi:hypothetical protein Pint_29989 [Pistacia integerrima]|uniref:Uncharacterized protein n=1 Tax=Pistacia integerrima TaxID=434235 RepID=A0ACC0X045_9ROSI|nr:hypothetical protein Pint_29989 [Pistacia integerrima]